MIFQNFGLHLYDNNFFHFLFYIYSVIHYLLIIFIYSCSLYLGMKYGEYFLYKKCFFDGIIFDLRTIIFYHLTHLSYLNFYLCNQIIVWKMPIRKINMQLNAILIYIIYFFHLLNLLICMLMPDVCLNCHLLILPILHFQSLLFVFLSVDLYLSYN